MCSPVRWNSIDVWWAPSYCLECLSCLIPNAVVTAPVMAPMSAVIAMDLF